MAAQTAYGIEAEVEGYANAYSPDLITFMDFRRHHSGVWEDAGLKLTVSSTSGRGGEDAGLNLTVSEGPICESNRDGSSVAHR